jgi:hypothetical protein
MDCVAFPPALDGVLGIVDECPPQAESDSANTIVDAIALVDLRIYPPGLCTASK